MKKLNLNNQISDDDDSLISLLKAATGPEPSQRFVENTMKRFLVQKSKPRKVHKPIKSLLYLMLVIGSILLSPTLLTLSSHISISDSGLVLENLVENISFQPDSWYTLPPILLALVLISAVWMELGMVKFRNPFV